ncbi:MAG: hypothetical protein WD529_02255 [Balneolaceae bacterium]
MKPKRLLLSGIVLLLLSAGTALAQVTISPTAVFLEKSSGVGSFYVSNPANEPVEVRLSFEFAYPQTDENGNVTLNYDDGEAEERYSLQEWLRAFPTTFVLQPGQRQTVRLVGRPPGNLEDGIYWTRMRVSSNMVTPPIGEETEGVTARVAFQVDQITAVLLEVGSPNTGLQIHSVSAETNDDQLMIFTDVERTGSAPFLGSATVRIYNSNDQLVQEQNSSTSVYFRNHHRSEFQATDLGAGTYRAEVTFESSRSDISSRNLIQMPPVSHSTTFEIE